MDTEQELFWAGQFGDEYTNRNQFSPKHFASRLNLLARIFSRTTKLNSLFEIGANIGLNVTAIQNLIPDIQIHALELNKTAFNELSKLSNVATYNLSILDFDQNFSCDAVLTSGLLIHINPESLPEVYKKMYEFSCKYIIICEYYNPTPVEVTYRGHLSKLFKRDFAGEMLDMFPDLELVDYGFVYHRDHNFPMDDGTWFLLQK